MSRKQISAFSVLAMVCGLVFLFGCDQIKGLVQSATGPSAPPKMASTSGEQPVKVSGTTLAKVNGDVITMESFDQKVRAARALSPDYKLDTKDEKKQYLDDLITAELVYQEAKARGLDKQKEVREDIDEFAKRRMATQLIIDETKGIAVDPAEVEDFYNKNKAAFVSPAEMRVSEIVVSSESTAKNILITLLQGADFASTAREKSIASSASKGGDLGWIKPTDKFDKFNEVISTLEQGQTSQIFKGPDGYYIVKVEEKKGGESRPFYEISDDLKTYLLNQKQALRLQELTDKLRREAKIEINEDLL